ncbi:MAG: CHASE2 domain-containing protein [Armatimonadota bacterium]
MAGHAAVSSHVAQQRARGIRTAVVIAAVIVVLRYLPLTSNLFFFSVIESFAYDVAFELQGRDVPSEMVIVAIDDESLRPQHLGRFPWSREVHARLIAKLKPARVVAFDVLFPEPQAGDPGADRALAEAVAAHGRVVLAAHQRTRSDYESTSPRLQGFDLVGPPGALQRVQALNFAPPIKPLQEAAAAVGYTDIDADPDGVYRRVAPASAGFDGKVYPHFALEVARIATGQKPADILRGITSGHLSFGDRTVPLTRDGHMLINYCGPTGTIPRYSCWEVLEGRIPPETFEDKIVFIGATAPGLYDIRPAPYRTASRMFMGVETNANIANTLMRRPPLTDGSGSFLWLLFAAVIGIFAGWVVWSRGEVTGPLTGLLILLVIALPSFFAAFYLFNHVIPYGAIILAVGLPVGLGLYQRLGAERQMIRNEFSSYVSPDVLNILMQNPEVTRQGRRLQCSLLFSDVRGSTALSENIEPEVWLAQLNEYMSQMTTSVFDYDGYLDKFIGDGIMAVWNAFGNQPDHPELAVRAGLDMLARLEALNEFWADQADREPFRIGIGIHTGEAVLGDAGSNQRRQFTAIGDAVNTAARIEAMNKDRGTVFLISETTAQRLEGLIELRELGEVEVRGRKEGIRIFEVLGEAGNVKAAGE